MPKNLTYHRKRKCLQAIMFTGDNNNNNNNGNFYSALPIKILTAQGAYKSDTNNNNITQTHTDTHTHTHTHTHTCTHTHTINQSINQSVNQSFNRVINVPLSRHLRDGKSRHLKQNTKSAVGTCAFFPTPFSLSKIFFLNYGHHPFHLKLIIKSINIIQ